MIRSTLRGALLGVSLIALPSLHATADTLALVPVGPGDVTGLSADGWAATGQTNGDYQTFRWTPRDGQVLLGRGTVTSLGVISGTPEISADGRTIASSILSNDGRRVTSGRWTVGGGWRQLAPPLPAGGGVVDQQDSGVFGMSADGQVVTGLFWRTVTGGSAHGFAWSARTGMVDMGSDGGSSRIDGASADGSVLAGFDESPQWGNRRAAIWMNGVKTILDDTDWPSEASAVNADGTIVVGQAAADNNEQAVMWRWNGSTWDRTVLGLVPQSKKNGTAYALGVSNDGSIVVGTGNPDGSKPASVGFIWTAAGGMVNAMDYLAANGHDLANKFDLISLSAITPDGSAFVAVGTGVLPPHTMGSMIVRRTP